MSVAGQNRKARRNYDIGETFEAGVSLTGTEVKSLRAGRCNLMDGYVAIQNGECYLHHVHISPYDQGNRENHDPIRTRKLLLKKEEIHKIKVRIDERGYTVIPLKIYFNKRGLAKVEIALAKGKKKYDKRDIIDREQSRKQLREVKKKFR